MRSHELIITVITQSCFCSLFQELAQLNMLVTKMLAPSSLIAHLSGGLGTKDFGLLSLLPLRFQLLICDMQ